jgi:class 3 adenylate cyclase
MDVSSDQEAAVAVMQPYDGYVAQYLGDGLLIYFGYPQAHEDDAQRAVRTGLGIVEAMAQLNGRLGQEQGVQLAVRLDGLGELVQAFFVEEFPRLIGIGAYF